MSAGFDLSFSRFVTLTPGGGGRRLIHLPSGSESAYLLLEYNWVDHLDNQIVDDAGNAIIFAGPFFGEWVDHLSNFFVDDAGNQLVLTDNADNPPYDGEWEDQLNNLIVDDLGNQIILRNI